MSIFWSLLISSMAYTFFSSLKISTKCFASIVECNMLNLGEEKSIELDQGTKWRFTPLVRQGFPLAASHGLCSGRLIFLGASRNMAVVWTRTVFLSVNYRLHPTCTAHSKGNLLKIAQSPLGPIFQSLGLCTRCRFAWWIGFAIWWMLQPSRGNTCLEKRRGSGKRDSFNRVISAYGE